MHEELAGAWPGRVTWTDPRDIPYVFWVIIPYHRTPRTVDKLQELLRGQSLLGWATTLSSTCLSGVSLLSLLFFLSIAALIIFYFHYKTAIISTLRPCLFFPLILLAIPLAGLASIRPEAEEPDLSLLNLT